YDISGKSSPPNTDVTGLARVLRGNFAAVEAQFASNRDNPDSSAAKALMALVYGTAASDFFFGLLDNTFRNSVAYSDNGKSGLSTDLTSAIGAAGGRLSYDPVGRQLAFAGYFDPKTKKTIDTAITNNGNSATLHTAVNNLAAANQSSVAPFFT